MISEPFFLDTPAGRLFAVHHRPAEAGRTRGHVLCALPFNEEMNRCRSMITLQARALSEIGFGTLVLDLIGTGDSELEFVDARWALWLDNLASGKAWLDAQAGGCRAIWGIRLGALLAANLHASTKDAKLALMLWQPVIDGKTHLTQFFRVRIAANMDRADVKKETTATMRAALAAGNSVEVAGYEIHPALAAAIDSARLDHCALPAGSQVLWLENANADQAALAPASQKLLGSWPGSGVDVDSKVFAGPAFWQVHERVLAPAAISTTTSWLQDWANAA